jgi:hypothetical protein
MNAIRDLCVRFIEWYFELPKEENKEAIPPMQSLNDELDDGLVLREWLESNPFLLRFLQ